MRYIFQQIHFIEIKQPCMYLHNYLYVTKSDLFNVDSILILRLHM